jgi:hypothetical protein
MKNQRQERDSGVPVDFLAPPKWTRAGQYESAMTGRDLCRVVGQAGLLPDDGGRVLGADPLLR